MCVSPRYPCAKVLLATPQSPPQKIAARTRVEREGERATNPANHPP